MNSSTAYQYQLLEQCSSTLVIHLEWRRMVLLTHPCGDKPSLQFMVLFFVSRWCQQVFLHSLSGDGHLLLVQNVLRENVTLLLGLIWIALLPLQLQCSLSLLYRSHIYPPPRQRLTPETLHQTCFQGLSSQGFIPRHHSVLDYTPFTWVVGFSYTLDPSQSLSML